MHFYGRVACRPVERLRGRVFFCEQELACFDGTDRSVYVAEETSIEDMPLIVKADAVITARGGLLSHAAIVCRELKKPCIVAMRDIHEQLCAGDLVEIDLRLGSVRIIQKS